MCLPRLVRRAQPASEELHVHRLDGWQRPLVKGRGVPKAWRAPCRAYTAPGSQAQGRERLPKTEPCAVSPVLAEGRLPRGGRAGLGFPRAAGSWFQHPRDEDAAKSVPV